MLAFNVVPKNFNSIEVHVHNKRLQTAERGRDHYQVIILNLKSD